LSFDEVVALMCDSRPEPDMYVPLQWLQVDDERWESRWFLGERNSVLASITAWADNTWLLQIASDGWFLRRRTREAQLQMARSRWDAAFARASLIVEAQWSAQPP
jgi:hypothetical protein